MPYILCRLEGGSRDGETYAGDCWPWELPNEVTLPALQAPRPIDETSLDGWRLTKAFETYVRDSKGL